jgi:hypothetical protein
MYTFMQKAGEEPDLTDVMGYLAKIVYAVGEIKNRLAMSERKDASNKDMQNSCEKILTVHLPKLINQYCSLTLKYRNETIVKEITYRNGIVRMTPKDVLLKDLAHLMEETQLLEKSFNESNASEFLSQSNLIQDNFGVQPQILLEGDTQPECITLQDNFDYESYYKKQQNYLNDKMAEMLPQKNPVLLEQQKMDKAVASVVQSHEIKKEKIIKEEKQAQPFVNPLAQENTEKTAYVPSDGGGLSILELTVTMLLVMFLVIGIYSANGVWEKTYHKGKYNDSSLTYHSKRGEPINTPHTQETMDASDMLHGEQLAQTFMIARDKIQQGHLNPDLNLVRFQPFEDKDVNQNLDDLGLRMMQVKKLYDNQMVLQVQNIGYKTCMATIEKLQAIQTRTPDFTITTSEASCSMNSSNTLEIILK